MPIAVTELGIIKVVKDDRGVRLLNTYEKAPCPIVVTEFPIVRDVIPVALMKEFAPISVMSFRITTAPVQADPSVKTVPS